MTRSILKSALTGAMLLGLATAAFAATGEYDNMCTMGLALGKDDEDRLLDQRVSPGQDVLLRQ